MSPSRPVRLVGIFAILLAMGAYEVLTRASEPDASSAGRESLPAPSPSTVTVWGIFLCQKDQCDSTPYQNAAFKTLEECHKIAGTLDGVEFRAECRAKQELSHEAEMQQNGWSNAQ